jgi:hypothetical protein
LVSSLSLAAAAVKPHEGLRATAPKDLVLALPSSCRPFIGQAALANVRLTAEQDEATAAGSSLIERLEQLAGRVMRAGLWR